MILRLLNDLAMDDRILNANTTKKLDSIHHDLLRLQDTVEGDAKNVISLINSMQSEVVDVQNRLQLLKHLQFPEITMRHGSVKAAHARTFRWILDQHEFSNWLKNGGGIYWIRGKAGSGKSTLMRFLVENPKTLRLLSSWAGQRDVVMASHFFWKSGTPIQKSLPGLLRTLLFQILRQIPSLIGQLFPLQWKSRDLSIFPLSADEVIQALESLTLENSLPVRFCFFIDGLDEYTTGTERYHGDFQELLNILEALSASSVIKICVSSRPWTVFERAFGNSPNKLRLEDLTKNDIKAYVVDKLKANRYLQELASVDSRCNSFGEQVVQKAEGVFLWVFLVIESLLNGASAADDFGDLQKRLDSVPAGLEDYFKHMLQNIEPIYFEQTVRILQITADAGHQLPLLAYHFIDRERENPDYALELASSDASKLGIDEACKKAIIRLNARCRDFLEVLEPPRTDSLMDYHVQFLHRTVRDFFLENDFLTKMIRESQAKVDSLISLCRIMLSLVKILVASSSPFYEIWPGFSSKVGALMRSARLIEMDFINQERLAVGREPESPRVSIAHKLLDELDSFVTSCLPSKDVHWVDPVGSRTAKLYDDNGQMTFLAYAIEMRLLLYVRAQLASNPEALQRKKGPLMLNHALCTAIMDTSGFATMKREPDSQLVELLLSKGADTNQVIDTYKRDTPWKLFLLPRFGGDIFYRPIVYEAGKCPDLLLYYAEFYRTLYLMISYGADLKLLHDFDGCNHAGIIIMNGKFMMNSDDPRIAQVVTNLNSLVDSKRSETSQVPWLSWLWGGSRAQLLHALNTSAFGVARLKV